MPTLYNGGVIVLIAINLIVLFLTGQVRYNEDAENRNEPNDEEVNR